MPHGNAVRYGNSIETARHAAALLYANACDVGLGIQRRIARRAVISSGYHANKRPRDFFGGQAHCVIIAAMWCAFWPHRYMAAWQFGLVELVWHTDLR